MLNFDPNMPGFFPLLSRGRVTLFINGLARMTTCRSGDFVAPDYRRKGIARSLFDKFQKETAPYPHLLSDLQTERVFLDRHLDLASHWGWLRLKRPKPG